MEVSAKSRYIRMSPKKIRLVLEVVKGMDVADALAQLKFINKRAAGPVIKLLNSASANATNNLGLEKSNLYIKKISANEGPTLKRWRARAFGRATPIRKRTSHIQVILEEKSPTKVLKSRGARVEAPVSIEDYKQAEKAVKDKETEITKETKGKAAEKVEVRGKKQNIAIKESGRGRQDLEQLRRKEKRGIFRRIFSRKTG